jgi:CubicO group peptidase (beta-lactamase class C family)
LKEHLSTAADSGFSGSVLIVEKGRVLIREGYGSANREKQVPITPETAFDIGSISKQFTKAAILLLEDRGDLSTDDPLSKFFPEAPEDKASVTIRHLIDHTSGLHEYHDTEGDFEPMDREEALRRILSQEPRFSPGEKQAYSNSGYTLLAIIVEEASGQPFQAFLRENLLEPAGMSRTGFYRDPLWKEEEVAVGYGGRTVGDVNSPLHWPTITWALRGNGGMVSSTDELLEWIRALRGGKILSEASLTKYYRGELPQMRTDAPGPYMAYAGGNDFGFISVILEFFGEDTQIIAASNVMGQYSAERIGKQLAQLILGEPVVEYERKEEPRDWGLPESPTGDAARAILKTIEAGTEEAAETFINENLSPDFVSQFSLEEHLVVLRDLQSALASPDLLEAIKTGPFSAKLIVRSRETEETVEISYELELEPPHRIINMRIETAKK